MSVIVKCDRPYNKSALKRIIESCGCCPPKEPKCPPVCTMPCPQPVCCIPCPSQPAGCSPCSPEPTAIVCMTCPPRPFICPPCTGLPCITCAPLPKPVPAPFEFGPVVRTPITTGGLFYTGTTRCYTCTPPVCCPP